MPLISFYTSGKHHQKTKDCLFSGDTERDQWVKLQMSSRPPYHFESIVNWSEKPLDPGFLTIEKVKSLSLRTGAWGQIGQGRLEFLFSF